MFDSGPPPMYGGETKAVLDVDPLQRRGFRKNGHELVLVPAILWLRHDEHWDGRRLMMVYVNGKEFVTYFLDVAEFEPQKVVRDIHDSLGLEVI